MKMNEFRDSCISGLSEKCLLKDQIHNSSVMISDEDFDPLTLPLDRLDADKVAECVSLFNIKENCANCSSRCGEALRKGGYINDMIITLKSIKYRYPAIGQEMVHLHLQSSISPTKFHTFKIISL